MENYSATKTSGQDVHGRPDESLSPTTRVLTGDKEGPIVNANTSTSKPTLVKKKCHGNRKAQRQRQKLRRQNEQHNRMDHDRNDVILQDNTDHVHTEEEEEEEEEEQQQSMRLKNKRKRDVSKNDPTRPLSQSLSQLSMSQQHIVKQPRLEVIESDEQEEQLLNHKHRRTPNYLTVPDPIFVRMLSKVIQHGKPIIQWLDTKDKIDLIRQMVKATNDIRYFDLQRQFWQDHYDHSLKEGIWGMELARSYAKQHRVCRAYSFKKHIIEQGLMAAKTELHRNLELLQKCMLQLETNAQHWQPTIDHDLLMCAIDAFVQQGQKRLRQEFEYKEKMLQKNAKDHFMIRSFYWIQPNEEQIHLARKIWQTTADAFEMKGEEEILRKRISLRRLSDEIDKNIDRTVKQTEMQLVNSIMDRDQRASLGSVCSKLVTQYKFDLSCLNLQVMENNRHGYQKVLAQLLKELSETDWADSIKQAIVDRQNSLIDRYETYLVHKLNTFFVEAPMV